MPRNSDRRGFASMDPDDRRQIARRGGEASQSGRGGYRNYDQNEYEEDEFDQDDYDENEDDDYDVQGSYDEYEEDDDYDDEEDYDEDEYEDEYEDEERGGGNY